MRLLTPSRSRVFLDKLTKLTIAQFLKGEFDISSGPYKHEIATLKSEKNSLRKFLGAQIFR